MLWNFSFYLGGRSCQHLIVFGKKLRLEHIDYRILCGISVPNGTILQPDSKTLVQINIQPSEAVISRYRRTCSAFYNIYFDFLGWKTICKQKPQVIRIADPKNRHQIRHFCTFVVVGIIQIIRAGHQKVQTGICFFVKAYVCNPKPVFSFCTVIKGQIIRTLYRSLYLLPGKHTASSLTPGIHCGIGIPAKPCIFAAENRLPIGNRNKAAVSISYRQTLLHKTSMCRIQVDQILHIFFWNSLFSF